MNSKGIIFVITAPSGAGKTTLYKKLFKKNKDLQFSVSCTTRAPRLGEKDKKDYFFISEKKFRKMIMKKEFVEWAKVHGYYYGTPKQWLKNKIKKGSDILLDIDVQGAKQLSKLFPEAVKIFIMPPSIKELEKRLIGRGKDGRDVIKKRLKNAVKELKYSNKCDFIVVNKDVNKALKDLETIILAEKIKKQG